MFNVTDFMEKRFSLTWVIWAVEKDVNSCFNMPNAVAKWVQGVLQIASKFAPPKMT